MKIPISKTQLYDNEINAALEPLKSGWLVQGVKVKEFESRWSNFVGNVNCIAVNSCTSGLELALRALNISNGDEVIVPSFTWISSASVIEHVGAVPVFCDIRLSDFNIDPDKINSLITSRTKCIIAVHLFGKAADMTQIMSTAKKNKLSVIEDAACGFGCYHSGQHVGTIGDVGVFSFHPRKAITTGEGGMITTHSEKLTTRLMRLRDHGAVITDLQRHNGPQPFLLADHEEAGFNYRMTDIQAAVGVEQMKRSHEILSRRRELAACYIENLKKIKCIKTPSPDDLKNCGFQSFVCLLQSPDNVATNIANIEMHKKIRNDWMVELQERGVSTRPGTHAIHTLTYFAKKYCLKALDYPNSFAASNCSIAFPLYSSMSNVEQSYVIDQIRDSYPR